MVLSALFVGETYAPTLLRRKAKALQKMADEQGTGEVFISKYDVNRKSRIEIIRVGMSRPLEMMAKELIIAALGTYGQCRLTMVITLPSTKLTLFRCTHLWHSLRELGFHTIPYALPS